MFEVFFDHCAVNEPEDEVLFSEAKSIYNVDQWKCMKYKKRLSKLKALDAVRCSSDSSLHFQEKVMNTAKVQKMLGALAREIKTLSQGDLAPIREGNEGVAAEQKEEESSNDCSSGWIDNESDNADVVSSDNASRGGGGRRLIE